MFQIIPLNSMTRNARHSIDNILFNSSTDFTAFYREILSPNMIGPVATSNPLVKKLFKIDSSKKETIWHQNRYEINNLLILDGMRTIELYNMQNNKKSFIEITPDNIYKNGKIYYGSPCILTWNGELFHRTISGENGCISMNFTEKAYKFEEIKEEKIEHVNPINWMNLP